MTKRKVRDGDEDAYEIRPEWLNLLPIVAAILASSQDKILDFDEAISDSLDLLEACTLAAEDLIS
jgi:hypothetical protein